MAWVKEEVRNSNIAEWTGKGFHFDELTKDDGTPRKDALMDRYIESQRLLDEREVIDPKFDIPEPEVIASFETTHPAPSRFRTEVKVAALCALFFVIGLAINVSETLA